MTAPDLTTMLRDTLDAHPGMTGDSMGVWCHGCKTDLGSSHRDPDLEAKWKAHRSEALAATVRDWLGSDEVRAALIFDIDAMKNALVDPPTSDEYAGQTLGTLRLLVQQIGDGQ